MEMVIRSYQGNLEDVMETGYRTYAANQQSEPNHWTEAQQHYFRLIDGGFESLGHDAFLAPCTYEESLLLNLHRFFFRSPICPETRLSYEQKNLCPRYQRPGKRW